IGDVFSQVDKLYYDDITLDAADGTNSLTTYFNGKHQSDANKLVSASVIKINTATGELIKGSNGYEYANTLNTPYKVGISVQQYKPDGNNSLDLVKIITMDVRYKVGNKQQDLIMTRIKQREVLIAPNAPDLTGLQDALGVYDSSKIIPIKYANNTWTVCSPNDSNWYNYSNGYWAEALVVNASYSGQIPSVGKELLATDITGMGSIYVWIPRYGVAGNAYFLYDSSDKYITGGINGQTRLNAISSTYTSPFKGTVLTGVWRPNNSNDAFYSGFNAAYPKNNK
ncbi:MAG: hypothetical protein FWC53_03435, partial [Firmicutes bacterium]|nr:hypothetical protein [Bacillota bacterium]